MQNAPSFIGISVMKELKVTTIKKSERHQVMNNSFRMVYDCYDLFTTEQELSLGQKNF